MYSLLNLMAEENKSISFTCTASVLGYCLLPMSILSMIAAVLSLRVSLKNEMCFACHLSGIPWLRHCWSSSLLVRLYIIETILHNIADGRPEAFGGLPLHIALLRLCPLGHLLMKLDNEFMHSVLFILLSLLRCSKVLKTISRTGSCFHPFLSELYTFLKFVSFLLCDSLQMTDLEKKLREHNLLVNQNKKGTYVVVQPTPGCVIKFKKAKLLFSHEDDLKCFINVAHCLEVPDPDVDAEEEEMVKMMRIDTERFKLPLSLGELDCVKDKQEQNSLKVSIHILQLLILNFSSML